MQRKNTGDTSLDSLDFDDVDVVGVENDMSDDIERIASDDIEMAKAAFKLNDEICTATSKGDDGCTIFSSPALRSALVSFVPHKCDIMEAALCLAFYFGSSVIYNQWIVLNERPLPVQAIRDSEGNIEYVREALFDQRKPHEESVPYFWVRLACVVIPVVQVLLSCFRQRIFRHDKTSTLCCYLVALGVTQLTTNSVKKYAGYLRPIFFADCQPNETYTDCLTDADGVRKSFPSSHASTAFCVMMLLTLYIHTRFGTPSLRSTRRCSCGCEDTNKATTASLVVRRYSLRFYLARLCSIASLLPMAAAVYVAASRVRDNKHHPADVVAGGLLGTSVAAFCHGVWFSAFVEDDYHHVE